MELYRSLFKVGTSIALLKFGELSIGQFTHY
jgi:hypothetical protein